MRNTMKRSLKTVLDTLTLIIIGILIFQPGIPDEMVVVYVLCSLYTYQ